MKRIVMNVVIVTLSFWIGVYVSKGSECNTKGLEREIVRLNSELSKWEDHAIRMKRIAGIPDTVTWSYKQKVIHPIDTHSLEKY